MELDELALKVKEAYAENPHLTVNLAASHIGDCSVQDVVTVLDEYVVTDDGVEHVGAGQGGGWAPSIVPEFEPTMIGWRWPDQSIREIPFDIDDPEHREAMGVTDEQYEKIKG